MRKVEGVFLGVLFVAVLVLYSGGGQPPAALDAGVFTFGNLVVLAFGLLAFHLIFEGEVWMMFPAYVSPLLLLLAFFFPAMWLQLLIAVAVSLCVIFSAFVTIVLPVPTLAPLPTHGLPVATITDCWTQDVYARQWSAPKTKGELEHWRLFMKLWYPADGSHISYKKGKKAPYLVIKGDDIFEDSTVTSHMGPHPFGQFEVLEKFESVTKSHFMNWTNTNSIYGAKISSGQPKWPVIIYSHGQGALPEKNTGLIERLVSKGYVVAAYYSDDRSSKWPGPVSRRQHVLRFLLQRLVELNTKKDLQVGIELASASRGAKNFVKMKEENMFVGRLDLERGVGLLGHSFGATTTLLMCSTSPQNVFKAHFEPGAKRKLKKLKRLRMQEFEAKKRQEGRTEGNKDTESNEEKRAEQGNSERGKAKDMEKEEEGKDEKREHKEKGKEKEKEKKEGDNDGEGEEQTETERPPRLPKIRCGVAMDTWMHPVWSPSVSQPLLVKKPLLCINSDLWLSSENGLGKLQDIYELVKKDVPLYVATMKGTSHQNFTDYCWLLAAHLPYQMIGLPRSFLRECADGMWHFGTADPFRVWFNVDNLLELFYEKHLLPMSLPSDTIITPRQRRSRSNSLNNSNDVISAEKERRVRILDIPKDDAAYSFETFYQE